MKQALNQTPVSKTVDILSELDIYQKIAQRTYKEVPMPSVITLGEIMDILKSIIYPGYFGNPDINAGNMKYYMGTSLDKLHNLMSEEIKRGFCFLCSNNESSCEDCSHKARDITNKFLAQLPNITTLLYKDVKAAYEGDPAAKSHAEVIFCYPGLKSITYHRIAHELYKLDVPVIPRIISEMSHSMTGIDIHPGAQIDESFFIDHGTGVVIGETCIIGKNVRIYQGVTLGAKSFPLDENGNPIKNMPRHPIVEDDVTIYAEATILGRITIGKGSVIGGNVWVTRDLEPGSKVSQKRSD